MKKYYLMAIKKDNTDAMIKLADYYKDIEEYEEMEKYKEMANDSYNTY